MAWTKLSANGRLVATETLTLSNASTATGSTIDFVEAGQDFVAYINTGSTNTAGAVTTDLEGSFDGTTFGDIDGSFGADCDTAVIIKAYDSSASGDHPYYRLTFDSVADDSSNDITVKLVVSG